MGREWLDRLYAPQWAGGWTPARLIYALSALLAHLPRRQQAADALAHPDIDLAGGQFGGWPGGPLGPGAAEGAWWAGLLGVVLLAWGGRLARPGLGLFLAAYLVMVAGLGLESRVPERALLLVGLGLVMGPIGERGLDRKARSPVGRWFLLLVACSLYGSTGWMKILAEPAWWRGEVLQYALLDRFMGMRPLGVWVSGQPWLLAPMSWWTLVFEAAFPLLVWWRRANPWLLLAGVCMHLGIFSLMSVGALTWTSLAMYPVLLDPERGRRLWEGVRARLGLRS